MNYKVMMNVEAVLFLKLQFTEYLLCDRNISYIFSNLFNPQSTYYYPILEMSKLRLREYGINCPGHTATWWQSWDLNPSLSGFYVCPFALTVYLGGLIVPSLWASVSPSTKCEGMVSNFWGTLSQDPNPAIWFPL